MLELGWIANQVNVDTSEWVVWLATLSHLDHLLELWLLGQRIPACVLYCLEFLISILDQEVVISSKNCLPFSAEVTFLVIITFCNCFWELLLPPLLVGFVEGGRLLIRCNLTAVPIISINLVFYRTQRAHQFHIVPVANVIQIEWHKRPLFRISVELFFAVVMTWFLLSHLVNVFLVPGPFLLQSHGRDSQFEVDLECWCVKTESASSCSHQSWRYYRLSPSWRS